MRCYVGDFNISNNQATNKVLFKQFMDLMASKGFKLNIDKLTHKKWDPRPGVIIL